MLIKCRREFVFHSAHANVFVIHYALSQREEKARERQERGKRERERQERERKKDTNRKRHEQEIQ